MLRMRKAEIADLDFLVRLDLEDEGITHASPVHMTEHQLAQERHKIAAFITGPTDAAWVFEDAPAGKLAGAILVRFRDLLNEDRTEANEFLFRFVDADWVPADGRFCEVFNLWVDPAYRRKGLATQLKLKIEAEAILRGIRLIYTHTEEQNTHVLELNRKIGYREIRRGPIWDEIIRVSLIKTLE